MCVSSRYNVQIHEEKFIKFINGYTNSILGYSIVVKKEGFQVVLMITLTPKDAKQLRIQGGAPPPRLRTKIFLISCSFGENLYVGAFPWRVGAPS